MDLSSKIERAQARVASVYDADAVLGYDRAQPTELKLFVFAWPDFGNDTLQAELSEMMSPTPVEIRQRLTVNQLLSQEYRNRGLGKLFEPREMEDIDLGEYERIAVFTPSAVATAELDNAIGEVIHANIDSLASNHRNIEAIYPCGHLFGSSDAQACIWIEVRHKEIQPLGDAAAFPDELGGYPVCIVEGGCEPLYSTSGADDVQGKLTAGCRVSMKDYGWTTVGCFVKDVNNEVGFLTSAHGGSVNDVQVYQPNQEDGILVGTVADNRYGSEFVTDEYTSRHYNLPLEEPRGSRSRVEVGLDVAFVKLAPGVQKDANALLPKYTQRSANRKPINLEQVVISAQAYAPSLGQSIYKLGGTTAFTRGTVMSTNAVCMPFAVSDQLCFVGASLDPMKASPSRGRPFVAKRQVLIVPTAADKSWNKRHNFLFSSFAEKGDSGAVCLFLQNPDSTRAAPVSLLHTRSASTGGVFTTPIHAILQALHLELI